MGLNRGLQVRGASRGSQMVSHKWFTATCGCMSGVRPVWMIGDVVLPAPAPAEPGTASPPYTRDMQKKKRRAFWRREEGGDWASVDEADVVVSMYGWIVVRCVTHGRLVYPRRSHSVFLPHSEGER